MLWIQQEGYRNCVQLLSQAIIWMPLLGPILSGRAQVLPWERAPQGMQMQVVQTHFRKLAQTEWLWKSPPLAWITD